MAQIHATADTTITKPMSMLPTVREKPDGLNARSGAAELTGMRPNLVDEAAAVATQAVMRASPHTTCPDTYVGAYCASMMVRP